jgi:uncharacterized SAM-binding protein YcdF (DUF218 family)
MRSMGRLTRIVLGLGALGLAILFAGFFVFASFATRPVQTAQRTADGIVVLTGGEHRLRTAGGLMRDRRAPRLLISGANRIATRADLRRLTGLPTKTFDCCVDIGYEARNTRGNAAETADWVRERGYKRLIVVTSSYHMPRSLAELSRRMPGVELYAHPVRAKKERREPWWLDFQSTRTLIAEYVKFVPAAGWYLVSIWFGGTSQTPPAPDAPHERLPGQAIGRAS